MEVVTYTRAPSFDEDYAPESYIAQGANVLMGIVSRDAKVIAKFSATGPSAGFDFDAYVAACKVFDKAAHRNALVLQEAQS